MKKLSIIGLIFISSFSVSYSQGFTIEEAMNYSFPENLVASPSMARVAWTENGTTPTPHKRRALSHHPRHRSDDNGR